VKDRKMVALVTERSLWMVMWLASTDSNGEVLQCRLQSLGLEIPCSFLLCPEMLRSPGLEEDKRPCGGHHSAQANSQYPLQDAWVIPAWPSSPDHSATVCGYVSEPRQNQKGNSWAHPKNHGVTIMLS
jgi:hypothetical protein